jgi:hypothetical protein
MAYLMVPYYPEANLSAVQATRPLSSEVSKNIFMDVLNEKITLNIYLGHTIYYTV